MKMIWLPSLGVSGPFPTAATATTAPTKRKIENRILPMIICSLGSAFRTSFSGCLFASMKIMVVWLVCFRVEVRASSHPFILVRLRTSFFVCHNSSRFSAIFHDFYAISIALNTLPNPKIERRFSYTRFCLKIFRYNSNLAIPNLLFPARRTGSIPMTSLTFFPIANTKTTPTTTMTDRVEELDLLILCTFDP